MATQDDVRSEAPSFKPGPWSVEDTRGRRGNNLLRVVAERRIGVARINATLHAEANANLIAAAPELYAALEALVLEAIGYWEVSDHHPPLVNAKAALAKARAHLPTTEDDNG